jgi:hypothetical protein
VCTYDLEGVGDNADSLDLLTVVTAVHHDRVGQSAYPQARLETSFPSREFDIVEITSR